MGLTVGSNQDTFNYKVVSQFAIVTVLWGIVGMLVVVILAAQLIWPDITFNIPARSIRKYCLFSYKQH